MTHKIVVKFYAEHENGLSHDDFVPVLHGWIQLHAVADHVLIDVVDYSAVHNGPGTLLVAHEATFYLDHLDGFLGLSYSRKQPLGGSFAEHLHYCIVAALEACHRLEEDPKLAGRLKFRTDEIAVKLNDRLNAPNTSETFDRIRTDVEQLATALWPGGAVEIEHLPGELSLFEVRLRTNQPGDVTKLLSRVGTTAPLR